MVCNPFRSYILYIDVGETKKMKNFCTQLPLPLHLIPSHHIMLVKVFDLNVCDDAKLMMINVLMAYDDDDAGGDDDEEKSHTHTYP